MGSLTAVLVTPAKALTPFHTHDSTLAVMHHAGLPLCPVGVVDRIPVQPVPLPILGAPTHANPHLLQAVILGLDDFVVDLSLELGLWEADQLQVPVPAVLQGFLPAGCNFSDFHNLWRQGATPEICPDETLRDKLKLEGIQFHFHKKVVLFSLVGFRTVLRWPDYNN